MRALIVSLGVLTALFVLSLIWGFGLALPGQGATAAAKDYDPRLANFANWPTHYEELGGDRNYVVPMSFFKGFSEAFTEAKGKAVIDFEAGWVSAEVKGLPILEDGFGYEVLLVDNRAGPGNSVALDTGPNGDDIINLGPLDVQGRIATLDQQPGVERLRAFEVDMAVVRRVGPGDSSAFVIGGLTELFYKWNRKLSLAGADPGGVVAADRKRAPSIIGLPAAEASPSVSMLLQSISQGESLFFNETFDGNGRTCGTCHRVDNNLTIDPTFIATLPSTDRLFVAELDAALAKLENPTLMRGPRGLILENIDGFNKAPVFRSPPPMINLSFTGPYGLSAEFATIPQFTTGAVMQHFPKNVGGDPNNITRVAGQDFRLPTQTELDDIEAFLESQFLPQNQDFTLDNFVNTGLEQQGRDLFFGSAKCSQCHGGTVLSDADAGLGGGNQSFATGVVDLAINSGANGGFGPLPLEAGGDREFSTPPLFGVKNTGPFFHDNSVATLTEAVAFYDSVEFNTSAAAGIVGTISLTSAEVDAIVAFLNALVEPQQAAAIPGVTVLGLAILAVMMAILLLWRSRRSPLRGR